MRIVQIFCKKNMIRQNLSNSIFRNLTRNNVSLEQFSPTPISLRPLTFAAVALKLYIPSTINTDYIFWHTQSIP
jgi:hypothetical protein